MSLESTANLEYNFQSKFQVVEGPLQQAPHKCAGCNRYSVETPTHSELEFITWNFDVEFYGIIFLCLDCIREMANQLGYCDPDQVKRFVLKIDELYSERNSLVEKNEELTNALASFRTVFGDVSNTSVVAVGENEPTEVPGNLSEINTGGEERSPEQNDESGSTNVSSDEDLNRLIADL